MPPYAFLAENDLRTDDLRNDLTALYRVGVPYTKEDIAKANEDLKAQVDPASAADLQKRYGQKPVVRTFYQIWKQPLSTVGGRQIISV